MFNGISTFMGYLMLKLSLQKNSSSTIEPIAPKSIHIFPKIIDPKVNKERMSVLISERKSEWASWGTND